jgi:hypothetical protein
LRWTNAEIGKEGRNLESTLSLLGVYIQQRLRSNRFRFATGLVGNFNIFSLVQTITACYTVKRYNISLLDGSRDTVKRHTKTKTLTTHQHCNIKHRGLRYEGTPFSSITSIIVITFIVIIASQSTITTAVAKRFQPSHQFINRKQ